MNYMIKDKPLTQNQGEELTLTRKLRQNSVVKRVRQMVAKGTSDAPWVVELDPTSACNLACPDCISKELLNQGGFERGRLVELAKEIVDAGVQAVILIGGGEPLAHPESGKIIEYFGTHGVHVGVTTNGTLIHRHLDCLAEHTKWVRVSVDAGTSETFQRFRPSPNGVSKFDQVIENMRNLAKRKKGKLGYSFLILSEFNEKREAVGSNVTDIYQAGALAKDIGCDYFEVKPSYDFNHYLIGQPHEQVFEAQQEIADLAGLVDDTFRVITPTTLKHVLNGDPLMQPKNYSRCAVSNLRTLVTPTGAYVCPYFRGRPDKRIGDVTRQSFADMWNSEKRAEVMAATDPSRDCAFHCIRHNSNLMLEQMYLDDDVETCEDYDFFV